MSAPEDNAANRRSAHNFVGRKVRISRKWHGAPALQFKNHKEDVGVVLAAAHSLSDDGGWELVVKWSNDDTNTYALEYLEIIDTPANAGVPLVVSGGATAVDISRVFAELEDVRALIRERLNQGHMSADAADALKTALRRLHEATYWIDGAQLGREL